MIEFACVVQEGVISEELRPRLASELARISTSILGGDPNEVDVGFTEIPRGFGFRGGELSTTSLVRGQIPPGCEQETRVELLNRICDMWCELTGCSTHELVVSVRDRGYPLL
jgi:phenylpyruvate tautomerase PptA (4-oxalocrotonate tautomerase family)